MKFIVLQKKAKNMESGKKYFLKGLIYKLDGLRGSFEEGGFLRLRLSKN